MSEPMEASTESTESTEGPPGGAVAVVGGSLAGLRAAEQLRAAGHAGGITVFSAEAHLPYNRPPLSKEVLAGAAVDPAVDASADTAEAMAAKLAFRRRSSTADVDFRLAAEVVDADPASGTLRLASGDRFDYAGLVVASGLRPRRLDVPGPLAGRHVLRTVEDAHHLRSATVTHPMTVAGQGRRVVVIGAGFIGCEVAATLSSLGHQVTVIDPLGPPMVRVLGIDLALAVQRHHEASGVRFLIGEQVAGFTGTDQVDGVVLGSGVEVGADAVVEAVGSLCNVEWLSGSGADLTDGVLTDNRLAVLGLPRTVAVGDIARFPNPLFDDVARRVEHWSNPTDTAKRAARTLVSLIAGEEGDPSPFAPVPSFWSDQFELRMQSFGSPALADEVRVIEGDLKELPAGVLATYHRAGRHVGTLAMNLNAARQRELRDQLAALAPS